ncbi:MAG: alkaline phosphatase family protein [Verrucomicrobiales bacterium]
MKSVCLILALAVLNASPAQAKIQFVIQISVDGLRGDLLRDLVTANPSNYPAFVRLQNEGAFTYNARCDFSKSETIPNHCTMVTGRPVDAVAGQSNTVHHGYSNNFPGANDTIHANGNPNVAYKVSTFDVAHDRGFTTAFLYGKGRLDVIKRSYDATRRALDLIGADNGRNKIDESVLSTSTATLLLNLTGKIVSQTLSNYTFLHITDPDTAGHAMDGGWPSARWNASVKTVDDYLHSIFTALDATSGLDGQVALSLTGDHGGGVAAIGGSFSGNRGHDEPAAQENYTIPFFIWGPGFPGGTSACAILSNRSDPAAVRPDYNGTQPIRNGDAANLSMILLGLPVIPDTIIRPELTSTPDVAETAGQLAIAWPCYLTGYTLEASSDLGNGSWQTVVGGIVETAGQCVFNEGIVSGGLRFFRLRPPAE